MRNGSGSEFAHFRAAYDAAFERYAKAVRDNRDIARAQAEYQKARNTLVEYLLSSAVHPRDPRAAVEQLAYALWRSSGCPQGTAERDWFRAEALVREFSHSQSC